MGHERLCGGAPIRTSWKPGGSLVASSVFFWGLVSPDYVGDMGVVKCFE